MHGAARGGSIMMMVVVSCLLLPATQHEWNSSNGVLVAVGLVHCLLWPLSMVLFFDSAKLLSLSVFCHFLVILCCCFGTTFSLVFMLQDLHVVALCRLDIY
jgi:hypothetical protein